MRKMKKMSKFIAVFLVFALALTVLPYNFGSVLAASSATEETIVDTVEEAVILSEIVDERDAYTKRFKMSDGTISAAQYDRPVHYLDENGKWVDYDNTFVVAGDTEDEGSIDDAVNASSDFNVRFSKKSNGNKIVTVKTDDYKISWNYDGINKSTVQVATVADDNDMSTLDKLTSEAVYKDVFTDTDIQYLLSSNELKENIILNSKDAPTEFVANYKGAGLSAEKIDDKTIYVKNKNGDTIFAISAPYMTDANDEYSDGVTLEIINSSDNKFSIKMVLDKEWLNNDDRAYPVTVDPIFETAKDWPSTSNVDYCQSAYISSSKPNTSFGRGGTSYEGSLYVGKESGRGKTRSFIKYTKLPELAECDKLVDARIYLYRRISNVITVDLYRVTDSWSQSSVTWNNAPSVDTSETYDYKRFKTTETGSWVSWEITELVRGWYSGEYENHGIMMKTASETSTSTYKRAWFFSTSYTSFSTLRPCIVISYRNMSGYEDYYSYTSMDAGRSGAASVNNYNGNLTFSQYLTQSAGGNLMPVSLSLVYNSNKTAQTYSTLGDGMQTNYHLFIAENPNLTDDSSDNEKKYKYYLNDADGTAHYFYFDNLTDTTAEDEDGLGYKITVNSSVSETSLTDTRYTVEDKNKNKMHFNGYGHLIKVEDSNGNASTVQYAIPTDSTTPRINTITDGAGRVYTFMYGDTDANLVTGVKDPANRQTTLGYTDGKLSSITYTDSKSVSFAYNSDNNLSRINGTNSYADITYGTEKRVSEITRKNGETTLEKYTFSYKQNETEITDYMDRSYTYQFNDFGQTTGIVSNLNGQAQFFSYTNQSTEGTVANKLLSESKVQSSIKNYITNPTVAGNMTDYSVRVDEGEGNSVSYVSDTGHFSNGAIRISKATTGDEIVNAYQSMTLPAGTYTLSAYVKSDGALTGNGALLALSSLNSNSTVAIPASSDWQRYSVIIETTVSQIITSQIGFDAESSGTIWVDDIQLEKNTGEGSFNLVENSGFGNTTSKWTVTATNSSVVTLDDGDLYGFDKALKISSDVTEKANCVQTVNVSGKKGDVFAVGAWAKAHSAPLNNGTKDGDTCLPDFELKIQFFDSNDESVSTKQQSFNPDVKTWQFNSFCAIAKNDYAYAKVSVIYDNNINELSTTGIYCNKEEYGQTYTYDKNGNVVSSTDLASTTASFAYKGNQMSMLLNPSGSSYLYSYDSETNNLLYANSTDGQQYSFTYDDKGNATQCVIEQSRPATTLFTSETYVLRNAYSGNALDADDQTTDNKNINNYHYESGRTNQQWVIETAGTDDVYTLKSVKFGSYLNVDNNNDGTKFTLSSSSTSNKQQFKIVANGNGTFRILTVKSENAKCVDGQPGDSTDTADDTVISQQPFDENDVGQQWYFYPLVDSSDKKITSSATYTEDKNFVSTVTDALGNTVSYDYDSTKGTMSSATDAKGNTLNYVYDDNNRITDIKDGSNTDLISYSYENDRLSSINAYDSTFYDFTYDAFGNTTRTRVGNGTDFYTLATNTYDSYGKLSQMTYGNGNFVNYSYDSLDRITEKVYNNDSNSRVTYKYNNNGSLSLFTDYFANKITRNIYDLSGRLVAVNTYNGTDHNNLGNVDNAISYRYADKTNYLSGITHNSSVLGTSKLDFTYGNLANGQMPDQIYSVKWNDVSKKNYTYDGLGRVTSQVVYPSVGVSLDNTYTYKDVGENNTSTQVSRVTNALGTYDYEYDANGNITKITFTHATDSSKSYVIKYQYDEKNQLISEDRSSSNYIYVYTYDDNGNMLSYSTYGRSESGGVGELKWSTDYEYTDSVWGDLLIDDGMDRFYYDEIGNPLDYAWNTTMTWKNGRQLETVDLFGDIFTSYEYNADGQRISKTVEDVTTEFFYAGDILAGQKTGDNVLMWIYDNNGSYIGFTYNGVEYYYVYNLQGDVEAITDATGAIVASYTYGAWGSSISVKNHTTSGVNIAEINPIRYRGYYYDAETNFYYLNSRYYDPGICRFINADRMGGANNDSLGYNLFSYCSNNPVNMIDKYGEAAIWLQDADAVHNLGHTGLLIQDSDGKWYHFYWGADGTGKSGKSGVSPRVEYLDGKFSNLNDLNKVLNSTGCYKGRYENGIYFDGDFSKSLEYAQSINANYDLLTNNCMQVSIDVLSKGKFKTADTAYKNQLSKIRSNPFPNGGFCAMYGVNMYVQKSYVARSILLSVSIITLKAVMKY